MRGEDSTIPPPTHSFNAIVEPLPRVICCCRRWDSAKNQARVVLAVMDLLVGGWKETDDQWISEAIRKLLRATSARTEAE